MNHNVQLATVGIICLLVGGAGGYLIRNSQIPARGQFGQRAGGVAGAPGANGQFRNMFGTQGGQRPTIGTIQDITATDMTLKTADGSSHVVLLSPTTTYNKIVAGQASDFPVGSNVIVTGQMQPDGSLTATSIQAAPQRPTTSENPSTSPTPSTSQTPTGY
jgi:hypothetical protein